MGRGRNGEGEEFDPLNLLVSIGTVLTLALILLLVMQFADINPVFRFGLLLLAMAIAAMVLVRRSYVRRDRRLSLVTEGPRRPSQRTPCNRRSRTWTWHSRGTHTGRCWHSRS